MKFHLASKEKRDYTKKINYVLKLEKFFKKIDYDIQLKKNIKKKDIFLNWDPQIIGYTKEDRIKVNEVHKINFLKKIFEYNQMQELGCMYSFIISFDNELFNNHINGLYNEEEFINTVKPIVHKYLVSQNFNLNNVDYIMNVHTDTDNFHIHIDMVEKVPTKVKNKLNDTELLRHQLIDKFEFNKSKNKYTTIKQEKLFNNSNSTGLLITPSELIQAKRYLRLNNYPKYYSDINDPQFKKLIDVIYEKNIRLNYDMFKDYNKISNDAKNLYLHKFKNKKVYSNKEVERLELRFKNQIFKEIKVAKFKDKPRRLNKLNFNSTSIKLLGDSHNKYKVEFEKLRNRIVYNFEDHKGVVNYKIDREH